MVLYTTEKGIELYNKIPLDKNIIGIYCSPCITLGGIIKIRSEDIKTINGFPNNFWGWGVEDRVLYNRSIFYNFDISFNILSRTPESKIYFKVFNNSNDRKKNSNFTPLNI